MRQILWATILTLVASSAFAATWKNERTLVNSPNSVTNSMRVGVSFVELPRGTTFFLRPTDTVANQAIHLVGPNTCRWNHGTTNADIEAIDAETGKVVWTLKANTNCDYSVIGECSLWEPFSDLYVQFRQKSAGTDGLLSCSAL